MILRQCIRCLAAATLAAGLLGEVRAQTRRAADNGAAAQEKVTRTPQQVAQEFVTLIERGRAPWQCYGHYSKLFQYLSQQQLKAPGGSQAVVERRRALAKQYQSLSALIAEMGKCAKLRHDIIENEGIDIPADERQAHFVEAGQRHDQLLATFKKATGATAVRPAGQ